jgi:hypothetical protein
MVSKHGAHYLGVTTRRKTQLQLDPRAPVNDIRHANGPCGAQTLAEQWVEECLDDGPQAALN